MTITTLGAATRPTRPFRVSRPSLLRLFLRAVLFWRDDMKAARDRAGFAALPDHTLRDIGLTRHDIVEAEERAARRAFP